MNFLLKNTLFLLFLLMNAVLNAQDMLAKGKDGRVAADEDWANGTAKYYFFGLRDYNKAEYENDLYLEHLGIYVTHLGCLAYGTERDYNKRIKEIVKEKYGRDIFKDLKKNARIFYDSLDRIETRKAIFAGGEKHLRNWFNEIARYYQSYIQRDGKDVEIAKNLKVTLSFTINRKGKSKNINLTKTESVEFNERMLRTFKVFFKYNRWLPAKQNGVRVAEEKAFEIVFNPD
jgi:hypothetical protein